MLTSRAKVVHGRDIIPSLIKGCSPPKRRRDDRLEDVLLAEREAGTLEVWLSRAKHAASTEAEDVEWGPTS
jgi:hypothetical protein